MKGRAAKMLSIVHMCIYICNSVLNPVLSQILITNLGYFEKYVWRLSKDVMNSYN